MATKNHKTQPNGLTIPGVAELNVGPVHLSGQDISGSITFRLAASHPEDVASYTAIEIGGLEVS